MDIYEERFWKKVDRKGPDDCWNFLGAQIDGYGSYGLYHQNRIVRAHRYAWEISRKVEVPKGKLICHLCDNKLCCNPRHLYCGTAEDNAADRSRNDIIRCTKIALSKARFYEGELWLIKKLKVPLQNPKSNRKYKFPAHIVAKIFKCDKGTILNIWNSEVYPCKEGSYVAGK